MMNNSDDKNFVDGRRKFSSDSNVEQQLADHFEQFNLSHNDVWRNFPIYTRRTILKRFLAHYELFLRTINLPGDIVELGVFRGFFPDELGKLSRNQKHGG